MLSDFISYNSVQLIQSTLNSLRVFTGILKQPALQLTRIHPEVNLFHLIGMDNYQLAIKYLRSLKLKMRNTLYT